MHQRPRPGPVTGRATEGGGRRPLASPGGVGTLAALPLLLFALFSWQLVSEGPLWRLDERLSRQLRQPVPVDDGPAELGADLGNFEVALPVLALAMVYAYWRRRRTAPLWGCGLAMLCVPALVTPLKLLFERPGPLGGSGYYPSGHTATAVVAYGAAVLLLWPHLRGAATRVLALLVALFLVTATATGLVVRGYHWPLDVLASCALASLPLLGLWYWGAGRGTTRDGARTSGPGARSDAEAPGRRGGAPRRWR